MAVAAMEKGQTKTGGGTTSTWEHEVRLRLGLPAISSAARRGIIAKLAHIYISIWSPRASIWAPRAVVLIDLPMFSPGEVTGTSAERWSVFDRDGDAQNSHNVLLRGRARTRSYGALRRIRFFCGNLLGGSSLRAFWSVCFGRIFPGRCFPKPPAAVSR